jgi:hypothetical protein
MPVFKGFYFFILLSRPCSKAFKIIRMAANSASKQRGREASRVNQNDPKLIRLPKQGAPCEWTGLSRAKMAQLVVPSKENGGSPPVRSISLGPDKDSKGWTRLIYFDSLMTYLDSKNEKGK